MCRAWLPTKDCCRQSTSQDSHLIIVSGICQKTAFSILTSYLLTSGHREGKHGRKQNTYTSFSSRLHWVHWITATKHSALPVGLFESLIKEGKRRAEKRGKAGEQRRTKPSCQQRSIFCDQWLNNTAEINEINAWLCIAVVALPPEGSPQFLLSIICDRFTASPSFHFVWHQEKAIVT